MNGMEWNVVSIGFLMRNRGFSGVMFCYAVGYLSAFCGSVFLFAALYWSLYHIIWSMFDFDSILRHDDHGYKTGTNQTDTEWKSDNSLN